MSIMNKLSMLGSGSVAELARMQKAGKNQDSMMRQTSAGSGNAMPAEQVADSPEERRRELEGVLKQLTGQIQHVSRELNFSVDQETDRIVVTVLDEATGDIIRQIPSEEMLRLARQMNAARERNGKGLLFSEDV